MGYPLETRSVLLLKERTISRIHFLLLKVCSWNKEGGNSVYQKNNRNQSESFGQDKETEIMYETLLFLLGSPGEN